MYMCVSISPKKCTLESTSLLRTKLHRGKCVTLSKLSGNHTVMCTVLHHHHHLLSPPSYPFPLCPVLTFTCTIFCSNCLRKRRVALTWGNNSYQFLSSSPWRSVYRTWTRRFSSELSHGGGGRVLESSRRSHVYPGRGRGWELHVTFWGWRVSNCLPGTVD